MKCTIPIFLFLQFLFYYSIAQNNDLKFSLVAGIKGKPTGKITGITQDPNGYMWFAGQDERCLYRYDGNRMISFRHDEANPNSLGIINIETIFADNSGMIWIGGDGLDRFNTATGVFTHYAHIPNDTGSLVANDVAAILKDRQGRVWIGTGQGLDLLDEKTGRFRHYSSIAGDQKSLSSNAVRIIYEDHKGVIWVGTGFPFFPPDKPDTDGGLNRLNPDGTFTRYLHEPGNQHSLINNKVRAIFEDSRGTFWVGTSGDGLHTMDREKGSFERHLYDPLHPDELSRPKLKPGGFDHITFITEDRTGALWIGTYAAGLSRYNPESKKVTHFLLSNGFPDSSSWNGFISREGELWISTENSNQLYSADPFRKSLYSIPTHDFAASFLEDADGFLWVGTTGSGLLKYDKDKKLVREFKHDPNDSFSLLDDHVDPLFQYNRDTILVGTLNGIRMLDTRTNKFFRVGNSGNLKDSANTGFVKVYRDKQGYTWFARWGLGLVRYNSKDNSFKHYLSNPDDSSSIGSNFVNSILEDSSGKFWTGGGNGINLLNRETGHFKHYLPKTFITSIYQSSDRSLWVGSDKSLFRYNSAEDKFSPFFNAQSELASLAVGGIIEDNEKNIWLTAGSSIVKLNPVTEQTFLYGARFGIQPHSIQPWGNNYKNDKGQLFIGYDNGFYIFSPRDLVVKTDFKIIITDLFINTVPVLPGKDAPINQAVEQVDEIYLKYNQNNIAFNFAGIDYRDPEAGKYFSRLEGYDNTWREALGEKSSYYFNISPGTYVYRVQTTNSDGVKAEKAITIHISPPWWKTWEAYSVYVLLLLIFAFIVFRIQKQRIIRMERQKAQLIELSQAKEIEKAYHELRATQAQLIQSEKMASLGELTAGIAHEIQNPLNFVNNFSEVNTELIDELSEEAEKGNFSEVKAIAKDIRDNEQKINHHGKRADAIVKSMLQHSRSNTGQKQPADINALADEYLRLAYHGLRAKDKSFNATLKTDFDETIGIINIIPQDVGRVLLNLYNNAFYAIAEKKKIQTGNYEPVLTVQTKKTGDKILVTVRDNGNGIPQKIAEKIFQPFFTTKPTGQGTGLGLSLSYDIIKAHGGEIKVDSKEGEYTAFTVQLPGSSTS